MKDQQSITCDGGNRIAPLEERILLKEEESKPVTSLRIALFRRKREPFSRCFEVCRRAYALRVTISETALARAVLLLGGFLEPLKSLRWILLDTFAGQKAVAVNGLRPSAIPLSCQTKPPGGFNP